MASIFDYTPEQLKCSLVDQIRKRSDITTPDCILIHIEDPHYKFYEMQRVGSRVHTRYGKIPAGQSNSWTHFNTPEQAQDHIEKKINEKLRKGYENMTYALTSVGKAVKSTARKTKALTPEAQDKLAAFLDLLK